MLFTPCCQSQCIQTNGLEKYKVLQKGHNLFYFKVSQSYSKAIKNGPLIELKGKDILDMESAQNRMKRKAKV